MFANKKIAVAKQSQSSILLMPKSQLAEFMQARIGGKGKLTASEVAEVARVSGSYISDLKNGKRDPWSCSAEIICRLAKGMKVSEVSLFQAIIGKAKPGVTDEYAAYVLEKFSKLKNHDRNDLEFWLRKLDELIDERLAP